MQVVVTGRHMSVTSAMKSYAEEKVQRLSRFFNRVSEIRVVLDFEGSKPMVEGIVDVEHADDFVARETATDMYAAIDLMTDKLEMQLRRHKERLNERHHKGARPGEAEVKTESE
jgi:putative sigma-54 modulation protein